MTNTPKRRLNDNTQPKSRPKKVVNKISSKRKVWTAKILTLYPEMFPGALNHSVTGRALKDKLWSFETLNIRDFASGKHKNVDGSPAGGGPGMVLKADAVDKSLHFVSKGLTSPSDSWPIIFLTPRGSPLSDQTVKYLATKQGITIVCGRFEGIDERVTEKWNMLEISIGDFVISGGEIAAMALIVSCVRHIPQVLGNEKSSKRESFSNGLLEYPQYTRPASWKGLKIPEILLTGHHEKIKLWRKEQSINITRERRPDLWQKYKKKTNV